MHNAVDEWAQLRSQYSLIAGVDEVGRGPLIGNVVTAAVILDPLKPISGLADSKKLTAKRRDALYEEIIQNALAYSVAFATPQEIDEINILHATMLAMQRAVLQLAVLPEYVMIDGNRCPDIPFPCEAVVKGDSRVAEISAASIVAKVVRDREMEALDLAYPDYGFAKHKGYPTAAHMAALEKFGPLDMHRRSFKPVARLLD
ncbi:ribonuclease HII [Neptunomonas phycophila]|uniref:Ribonuclease HII n=1 Tax=Neptunomonas phycophila TaxID=1572645 RepID=A0ABT9EWY4_9GAMM|nr:MULTISPECIES: ribonuclease HII [Neptunomonas]MBT3144445.1 ribonuclease HII [Neptunomonas phycophila]MDN2660591.1 ribonuclease HII [Neptunomonas sp. CHC150]MDO6468151.1 ribonuclease HII [Neptunomonas phycophila]MDP2523556.1 ribonuclease HII [Neptunomonas phycophila]